jgi:hypothetical protein
LKKHCTNYLLQQLWNFVKKNLTIEEIENKLLSDTGIMRNIIWLRAANPRERRHYRK